ncbi:MAG: GNAT family N-acetyltransferase [Planctomycetota bacterium]
MVGRASSAVCSGRASRPTAQKRVRQSRRSQAVLKTIGNRRSATSTGRHVRRGRVAGAIAVPANAADHAAIQLLLEDTFPEFRPAAFRASLVHPFYQPRERLLEKRGEAIVGHVHVRRHTMHLGRSAAAVAVVEGLAVRGDCRGSSVGARLLEAAQETARGTGAVLAAARTRLPQYFCRFGWVPCGRHHFSRAGVRALLARMLDECHPPRRTLHIRPWRRWELPALARIYRENLPRTFGAVDRSEAYWNWLIECDGVDQIFVALEGPDRQELASTCDQVVGYAAIRGGEILELMTLPDHPSADRELLARTCGDAIEHDRHALTLHAPPNHPLHRVFLEARGERACSEADRGEVFMVRLLSADGLVRRLHPVLVERLAAAGNDFEVAGDEAAAELGLLVGGEKLRIEVSRREAHISAGRLGRSYLQLGSADFCRLLLGELHWDRALEEGRVRASTLNAFHLGRVLFPYCPLWHAPWDAQPARDSRNRLDG